MSTGSAAPAQLRFAPLESTCRGPELGGGSRRGASGASHQHGANRHDHSTAGDEGQAADGRIRNEREQHDETAVGKAQPAHDESLAAVVGSMCALLLVE